MSFDKYKPIFNNIIKLLLDNTDTLVATFYSEKKSGFFNSNVETYSPYLKLNDSDIICISNNNCTSGLKSTVLNSTKDRKLLLVESGSNKYLLQVLSLDSINIFNSKFAATDVSKLDKYSVQLEQCSFGVPINNDYYVGSDEYTNNLLISLFLNYIYDAIPRDAGLKGYQKLLATTIQDASPKRLSLSVYEYSESLKKFMSIPSNFNYFENRDIGEFGKAPIRMRILSRNFIIDVFTQLLVNLEMLQNKFEFNHGDLTASSIGIVNEPVKIEYSTIKHQSNLTFKLINFKYSSITINSNNKKTRLFNSNSFAEKYFVINPFKPVIDSDLNELYYKVDDILNVQTLAKARHTGLQFYPSFDTMTLVASLLTIPEIYYSVLSDPILKNMIWDVLWHPKDQSQAYKEFQNIINKGIEGNYENIIGVLKGKWIKCKLTEQLILNLSKKL